ncbi:MAG: lipoprotein signal peptidase [Saprospiraceae bacterium]
MKSKFWLIAIVLIVLTIDQSLKIWVKTHMEYGEEFRILGLDWALIHFVENNGMAFGLSLGGEYGKLVLSIFRIIAVGFLVYYLNFLLNGGAKRGILISFSLILAGAIGNIIDSAVYGMIFSESTYHGGLAEIFPEAGGYSSFLHGKVVDMFYFPIINGFLPDWLPLWGGKHILFFQPVFNVADASISLGVINMLLFNRTFFANQKIEETEEEKKESN